MTPEQFKEKGCYVCGIQGTNLIAPRIPVDSDSTAPVNNPKSVMYDPNAPLQGIPVREPYLLCTNCDSEFPFEFIAQLDNDSWQYGYERRHGRNAVSSTVYNSEAQFNPEAMKRGFLTQEEEDVERPG